MHPRARWLAVLFASGCGGSAFVCTEDAQCLLGGEPGVCQADGNCSYPDAECPSGYRYPTAAGGECVPGTAETGVTDVASAGTAEPSGSDTSTTTSSSGATAPTSVGVSSGSSGIETATSAATGSPPACEPEPAEPILLFPVDCGAVPSDGPLFGELDGSTDSDRYEMTYDGMCPDAVSQLATVESDQPMRVCVYYECLGLKLACGNDDTPANQDDLQGCCSQTQGNPVANPAVSCGGDVTVHVVVDGGPDECTPYSFLYGDPAMGA